MSVDEFLSQFPEFTDRTDEDNVASLIGRSVLQNNGFEGLPEGKRDYAIALYTAYLLENAYPKNQMSGKGAIKRVESFNQKIEFAVNNTSAFDLDSNIYGTQLKDLINGEYMGGLYV